MARTDEQFSELTDIFENYKSLGGCLDRTLVRDLALLFTKHGAPELEELKQFFSKDIALNVENDGPRCSFCGKRRDMVPHMIACGKSSFLSSQAVMQELHICNECVAFCQQMMSSKEKAETT
jgi:hypothetical protein